MKLNHHIRYGLKYILASFLYYSGILFIIKKVILRKRAVILMYHRVLRAEDYEKSFSHPGIIVTRDSFEKHLNFLQKHFAILSQDQFLHHIETSTPFRDSSCLITFDDGWQDNYTTAFPLLQEKNLPALIFLATDYIGTGALFWQEKLSNALFSCYRDPTPKNIETIERCSLGDVRELSPKLAKIRIREYVSELKTLNGKELQLLLDSILSNELMDLTTQNTIDIFMDWSHVKEMAQSVVTFGSHSIHHYILTNVPIETASKEIIASKKIIEKNAGLKTKIFCYPNGNHSTEVAEKVRTSGYQAAVSTQPGLANTSSNRYSLPRINIHEEATANNPMLMMKILGIY